MKSKCPYCGKVIELQPEYFKRRWTCDNCGHEYIVGVVYIPSKAFSNGVTKILCPHCGQRNVLPLAAANNDVDCGSCGRTFHVHITQSSSQDPKTLSTGNKAKNVWIIIPWILIGISLLVVSTPFVLRTVKGGDFGLEKIGFGFRSNYTDLDCALEIQAAIAERNYALAMKWAKRIKDERERRTCIAIIKDLEHLNDWQKESIERASKELGSFGELSSALESAAKEVDRTLKKAYNDMGSTR